MGDIAFDRQLFAFTLDDVTALTVAIDDAQGAGDEDMAFVIYAEELSDRLLAFSVAATLMGDDELRRRTSAAQAQLEAATARRQRVRDDVARAQAEASRRASPPSPPRTPPRTASPLPDDARRSRAPSTAGSRSPSPGPPHPSSLPSTRSLSPVLSQTVSPLPSQPPSRVASRSSSPTGSGHREPDRNAESTIDCMACLASIPRSAILRTPCSHAYDAECMILFFRAAVADEMLFPPRCCGQEIALHSVRASLPTALVEQYERRVEARRELLTVRCPTATCSRVLGLQPELPAFVACPSCSTRVCSSCRAAHEEGMTCAQHEDALPLADLAHNQRWQRCRACRRYVEHSDGCWHMTCHCGAQFCYTCGAPWKTCACVQFAVPPEAAVEVPAPVAAEELEE